MKSDGKINNIKGFTLVELLIALVLASFMFAAVFTLSIQSLNILQATRCESMATQAAQYEIEKLRSYSWSIVENMAETTSVNTNQNAVLSLLNAGAGTIKKTLYQPHQISEPIYAISVTVSWTDFKGDTDSKTVTSVITETGMIK